jgi:hypothetical protein
MRVYFYSPLSPSIVIEKSHPTLLLLFILKELLKDRQELIEQNPHPGPFEWTAKGSSEQKLQEHFSLLPFAFPELASHVPALTSDRSTQELFQLLEPFILASASDENLLLFLVRHEKELAVKQLLDRICPDGLDAIKKMIAAGYKKRGYHFTQWTHSFKTL